MDHRYLDPDDMIPGVEIEGAGFFVDLLNEYDPLTFSPADFVEHLFNMLLFVTTLVTERKVFKAFNYAN